MPETDGVDAIIEQWRRERPELDHSPVGVVGRVSRLARELEARLEAVYREHGLEPGWHDVLATLRRTGPPVPAAAVRLHGLADAHLVGHDQAPGPARAGRPGRARARPRRPPRRD